MECDNFPNKLSLSLFPFLDTGVRVTVTNPDCYRQSFDSNQMVTNSMANDLRELDKDVPPTIEGEIVGFDPYELEKDRKSAKITIRPIYKNKDTLIVVNADTIQSVSGKIMIAESLEKPYKRLSNEEIGLIALGLVKGQYFHSSAVQFDLLIKNVFMPLAFCDEHAASWLKGNKISSFFGAMSQAGSRAINGYPVFHTIYCLNTEDSEVIIDKAEQLDAALKYAL